MFVDINVSTYLYIFWPYMAKIYPCKDGKHHDCGLEATEQLPRESLIREHDEIRQNRKRRYQGFVHPWWSIQLVFCYSLVEYKSDLLLLRIIRLIFCHSMGYLTAWQSRFSQLVLFEMPHAKNSLS